VTKEEGWKGKQSDGGSRKRDVWHRKRDEWVLGKQRDRGLIRRIGV
jgi:hypothetical protein